MLPDAPALDVVNHLHMTNHVLLGDERVAYVAEKLRHLERSLATIFSVPDVVEMVALLAVMTANLMVLQLGHGLEKASTVVARMLKRKKETLSQRKIILFQ